MLRVTVLELPATWGDPRAALATVDAALERGGPTDLVLLPEASLSGYVSPTGAFDLTAFAEPIDGATASGAAALARRHRVNLVAPLVLSERGRAYNAMVAFDRDGKAIFTYRKRHPWFPETWAAAGELPAPTVDVEGTRVTIAICFDVHFLHDDAADALDAADLLLFPSAWVEEVDSRPAMLAALARRHGIAIANANWGPGVVRIPGQGRSSLLDAAGCVLATTTDRGMESDLVGRLGASSSPPRVMRADAIVSAGDAAAAADKVELAK